MKLLHTSDWHLGRSLYGRKRYEEFDAFLDWLVTTLADHQVDALLVAGDIFDTGTPSNRAQQQYYRFLRRVTGTGCRHVVLIGGNHDSPTFLNAPRELLRALDVHVLGAISDNLEDEVVVLSDSAGEPEAVIAAVPYLRDRDIRTVAAGESIDDKDGKLQAGIHAHYAQVVELADQRRRELGSPAPLNVPLIGMGHLFAAGGQTVDGDGVRELYVGSLAHVPASIFPPVLDYVALGHLHVPQVVAGRDHIRYSGSPLAMGFGEANQQKTVCLVTFDGGALQQIRLVPIPCFQRLAAIAGDWPTLEARIQTLAELGESIWLELNYTGEEVIADLRERLVALVEETPLEILRVKNTRLANRVLSQADVTETLDDLDEQDVFERCLETWQVPEEQREWLRYSYREVLVSLHEQDARAE